LGCVDRSVEREPVRRPRRPSLDLNDYLAVALVLLAGFLRFRELTAQSLWLDECLTVHVVRLADFRDVLAWLAIWSDLGPFHSILTWLLRPFGAGELAAGYRLPWRAR
jgi:hypothetical protein